MVRRRVLSWSTVLRRPWQRLQTAQRLIEDFGIHSLDGIDRIAEQLGFAIEYVDLPKKVGGFVLPLEGQAPVIVINPDRSPLYQRYTIAHELAHCLFHVHPHRVVSGRYADLEADSFAFICLSLSVPSERHLAVFALHNLDLAWRMLSILAYIQVGHRLNRLADWLTNCLATPHPKGV